MRPNSEMNRLLLIDNSESYLSLISEFLDSKGFTVYVANNSKDALFILGKEKINVIILEVRLLNESDPSDKSGIEFAKRHYPEIPKIFVSAFPDFKTVREILSVSFTGHPTGVDFISKDEEKEALITAINSVINSSGGISELPFIFDEENYQLLKKENIIKLTPQEFHIIKYLVNNPNRIVLRSELLHQALGEDSISEHSDEKRINNIIWRLRKKFDKEFNNSDFLVTVRGRGYRLIQ